MMASYQGIKTYHLCITLIVSTIISTQAAQLPQKPALEVSNHVTNTTTPVTSILDKNNTEEEEAEPITSTVDSLSVNLDETKDDLKLDELVGIQPKSINRDTDDYINGYLSSTVSYNDDKRANLFKSIDTTNEQEPPLVPESPEEHPKEPDAVASSSQTNHSNGLNMSQIDKSYIESRIDEEKTAEMWQNLNRKLKKGISSSIGSIVPWALNMTQEVKISSNCSGAALKWILSMNQLKLWALRMLDATGKPIAGLLEGSMTMFGNYQECLKIRAPDEDEVELTGSFKEYFRGKYCIIQAKPWLPEKKSIYYNLNTKIDSWLAKDDGEEGEEQVPWYDKSVFDELSEWAMAFNFLNLRIDVCLPSLCTREDIQKMINFVLKDLDVKARVSRCEFEAPEDDDGVDGFIKARPIVESNPVELPGSLPSSLDIGSVYQAKEEMIQSRIKWLIIPAAAVVIVSLASLLSPSSASAYTKSSCSSDSHSTSGAGSARFNRDREILLFPSKLKDAMGSLSLRRSLGSHLNIDYEQLADDKPLALYGLRFIFIIWIILVESCINLRFEFLRELLPLKDLIFWWPMQFMINSTLQYDSIILLAAFTMGYKYCCLNNNISSSSSSSSNRNLFKFIFDKYMRLMPSIMLLVAAVILLPLAYSGPVWNDYVMVQSSVCQSNGWLNMLFLQNYLPYKEMCLPQTWLISVQLQLTVLMAPLVYYLNKSYMNHAATSASEQKSNIKGAKAACTIRPFFWIHTGPGLILVGSILFGSIYSFLNVYSNKLPPSWLYTMADPDSKAEYFARHLMKIWTHMAVFAIGILAGLECRRASNYALSARFKGYNMALIGLSASNNSNNNNKNDDTSATAKTSATLMKSPSGDGSSSTSLQQTNIADSLSTSSGLNSSTISINLKASSDCSASRENVNGSSSRSSSNAAYIIYHDSTNGSSGDEQPDGSGGLCNKLLQFIGYTLAILTMSVIVFSTHEWSLNELPEPSIAGLYDSMSRFLWSLALIWILYKVSVPDDRTKKFSSLSMALGHPVMVFLGKLSFLIYIIHPFVHLTVLAIQEQPIYSSWLMLFHILIGNLTITVILASLVSLFVEMPFRNLFRRRGGTLILTHTVAGGVDSATSG